MKLFRKNKIKTSKMNTKEDLIYAGFEGIKSLLVFITVVILFNMTEDKNCGYIYMIIVFITMMWSIKESNKFHHIYENIKSNKM